MDTIEKQNVPSDVDRRDLKNDKTWRKEAYLKCICRQIRKGQEDSIMAEVLTFFLSNQHK